MSSCTYPDARTSIYARLAFTRVNVYKENREEKYMPKIIQKRISCLQFSNAELIAYVKCNTYGKHRIGMQMELCVT